MRPFLLHTHFYQPERLNPWTQALDPEPSAAPFQDWNERIHHECYQPNAFARVYDASGRVERIVNTYEWVSFNFGPTLLAWLEDTHPATYARILAADRSSVRRLGHGNALAQAFHHSILPLETDRDRRTQIRWGLTDFRERFGRQAEGMWLPETAASQAVADALIDEGVHFTVLAPHQATKIRQPGQRWRAVAGDLDVSRPYRLEHSDGSGRSIAVFFYDGALAQRFAFDPATMDSSVMSEALVAAAPADPAGLIHAALDGETFGHHHRFGELGLAYTMTTGAPARGLEPTNYGAYLAACPPAQQVELVSGEGSAWSCAHGVGRWTRDCGCSTNAGPGWSQAWRAPLREALGLVREAATEALQVRGGALLDPWRARDEYVRVLIGAETYATFLRRHTNGVLDGSERRRVGALLEAHRNTMAAFTSCGWFFADVSGIETVYVLRFAARALDLLEEAGADAPREKVLRLLSEARSNRYGTGADVWRDTVERSRLEATLTDRVAAAARAGDLPEARRVADLIATARSLDLDLTIAQQCVYEHAQARVGASTASDVAAIAVLGEALDLAPSTWGGG